jgi:hypothetical protein
MSDLIVFKMSAIPKYTKDDINIMRDQMLTMNLDRECLPSTGSETEKRERLLKHFYPTTLSPNANMSAMPKYTKGQINSLPLAPLKDALAALGLPFNGGKIAGRASLKAALYPPQVGIVGMGAVFQTNPGPLPSKVHNKQSTIVFFIF